MFDLVIKNKIRRKEAFKMTCLKATKRLEEKAAHGTIF